jgi:hypothetical protein
MIANESRKTASYAAFILVFVSMLGTEGGCGSSNGAGGTCDGYPSSTTCEACVFGSCCSQFAQCQSDSDCNALITCIGGCGSDESCQAGCQSEYSTGVDDYNTYYSCVTSTCESSCGSSSGSSGGSSGSQDCRSFGSDCSTSSECCSGFCETDSNSSSYDTCD